MESLEEILSSQLESFPQPSIPSSLLEESDVKSECLSGSSLEQGSALDTPKTSPIPPIHLATPPDVKEILVD